MKIKGQYQSVKEVLYWTKSVTQVSYYFRLFQFFIVRVEKYSTMSIKILELLKPLCYKIKFKCLILFLPISFHMQRHTSSRVCRDFKHRETCLLTISQNRPIRGFVAERVEWLVLFSQQDFDAENQSWPSVFSVTTRWPSPINNRPAAISTRDKTRG